MRGSLPGGCAVQNQQECGPATKGYYKELMLKFPMVRGESPADGSTWVLELRPLCIAIQVVDAFLKLEKPYQDAIAEVTQKMGAGMAEFIEKEVSCCDDAQRWPLVWPDPRIVCRWCPWRTTTSIASMSQGWWASACPASSQLGVRRNVAWW